MKSVQLICPSVQSIVSGHINCSSFQKQNLIHLINSSFNSTKRKLLKTVLPKSKTYLSKIHETKRFSTSETSMFSSVEIKGI